MVASFARMISFWGEFVSHMLASMARPVICGLSLKLAEFQRLLQTWLEAFCAPAISALTAPELPNGLSITTLTPGLAFM